MSKGIAKYVFFFYILNILRIMSYFIKIKWCLYIYYIFISSNSIYWTNSINSIDKIYVQIYDLAYSLLTFLTKIYKRELFIYLDNTFYVFKI